MKKCVIRPLFIFVVVVLLNHSGTPAATFTTAGDGDWHNPSTRDLGIVPSPSADIIVNHRITATIDIFIEDIGRLEIGIMGVLTFDKIRLKGFLKNNGRMSGEQLIVESGGTNTNMVNLGYAIITDVTLASLGSGSPATVNNFNKFLVTNNLINQVFLNNQRNFTVKVDLHNFSLIHSEKEFSLLTVGKKLINDPSVIKLDGRLKLGLSDHGNPLTASTIFENHGSISKIGNVPVLSGVFDGNNEVVVVNNGQIVNPVYLCIGPPSNHINNNPPQLLIHRHRQLPMPNL